MPLSTRMRMATTPPKASDPLLGIAIGDAFMGGYLAGVIDTTKGNIIAADTSQTGLRYALICSPRSLQQTALAFKTTLTASPSQTRWNGLASTVAMTGTTYPATNYCNGLTFPADGGSQWYLPALDEMDLLYRSFKPTAEANSTAARDTSNGGWLTAVTSAGQNVSCDPAVSPYTTSVPTQTTVTLFKSGGAQGFSESGWSYWTSTDHSGAFGWQHRFASPAGLQYIDSKYYDKYVRPVRRFLL